MRFLIIEDEKRVAHFVKKGLEEESYAVDVAETGKGGLFLAETESYDLVILDILLPDIDGVEVLKQLRLKGAKIPVLMLTARKTVQDKVEALNSGADDYLTKPFAFAELVARIRALLRRGDAQLALSGSIIKIADMTIDLISRKVIRNGKNIVLTSKEFALLEYFVRNQERVLTRTMIAEHVWDYNFDTVTNLVDVHVKNLRRKIDGEFELKLIHTVRGTGYVMRESCDEI